MNIPVSGSFCAVLILLCVSTLNSVHAQTSEQLEKRMKLLEMLDRLDDADFEDALQSARDCIIQRRFDCGRQNLEKAETVALSDDHKSQLHQARESLDNEIRLVRDEQEAARRLAAEERRLRREQEEYEAEMERERERLARQSEMDADYDSYDDGGIDWQAVLTVTNAYAEAMKEQNKRQAEQAIAQRRILEEQRREHERAMEQRQQAYYQRQQEIENRRRDMARQQQERQRELANRQEVQRQMIARQQEEQRQARERRQQELREQQRRAREQREQKQRENQRRAEEQMQKQQRENERRMKQLAQASKNVAPSNCQSYAETIPQMDKICFKESKRQYRCTLRNGEPFLSYIQTLIFDSSVEEGSHCDVVDRTNTHPNGSPYGTPFDK